MYEEYANAIDIEGIMFEIINDKDIRKEAFASIHKKQSISRDDRFFVETKERIKRVLFDIKILMTRDVKRFNNTLKDKFMDLLDENISEKFKQNQLTRRDQRSRFEERKDKKRDNSYSRKD